MTTRVAAWLVIVTLLTLTGAALAHADPSPRRLRAAIELILERPELAHAFWGIEVRSLESGKVLYEHNATKAFRPASTLKLVTTAAALDVFGPDARVRTTLETAARLDGQGRLLGDVYLVGRGDASLSSRLGECAETGPGWGSHGGPATLGDAKSQVASAEADAGATAGADTPAGAKADTCPPTAAFEEMADALVAAGVRRIEGRLIGHEGAFSGDPQGLDWMREDLDWGYGAPVSALSFADNAVRVTLTAGERPGDPAVVDVVPRTRFFRVESTVVTGDADAEEDVTLARVAPSGPGSPERARLSGLLPLGGEWEGEVAIQNPALFAATVLAAVFESRELVVSGAVTASSDRLPPELRVIAAHDGAPLARLIAEVNKESLNLHAELLLRRLGLAFGGEGRTETGLEAVDDFLDRLSIPRAGWGLKDGSGLSHSNLVTPRGLAALLVAMDRHVHAEVFRSSLPVSGIDGHLEDRMRGTPAEGRVVGKTGAMQSVTALAGYVTTVGRERLAFVVIVNNHVGRSASARRAIDDLATTFSLAR